MSSFISAALGLIVVFLMASGAVYSVIRIYRALNSEPAIVDEAPAATKPGASQRARNSTSAELPTRSDRLADGPIQSSLPVEKPGPTYSENDEEPVPVIFRRPAA